MSTLCDRLESFADGELPPAEAQAFGEHLAGCARCQVGLTGLLQLEQLGRRYLEEHGPVVVPWYLVPRNRWVAAGAAVALAVVLLLLTASRLFEPSLDGRELWAQRTRSLEARVTYPQADIHRPLDQSQMGERSEPALAERRAPAGVLETLEGHQDFQQLAAAYLAVGTPDATRAQALLQRRVSEQPTDVADVICDLGVAHYVAKNDREALRLFTEVLRQKPTHVQALWNRALVYRRLGLPLLAIEDFSAVERADSDEGWRTEARAQKDRLSGVLRRKERWMEAARAGDALIARGAEAVQEALKFADVPMMRRDFYDAVRARTSATDVLALLPLAQRLDGMAGGSTVLANYVRDIASRDFKRRTPLAQRYARILSGPLEARELEGILKELLASGEEDIAIGALVYTSRDLPQYSTELVKRTRESKDPWFKVLGLQFQAALEEDAGKYANARKLLEEALNDCEKSRLLYRCIDIEDGLSHILGWLFLIDEAESHARKGLALARQASQWDKEGVLLQTLGNVSRIRADVTLGRAYFGEALRVLGRDPKAELNIHQNLAHLAIQALELDEARAEIDRAMAAGSSLTLTLHGVEALVDITRTHPSPRDEATVAHVVEEERTKTPGRRAYAKFLEGRFIVETDPGKGRALLEEAIREAESAGTDDINARHARAYSYTSLIFDDAKRGDFVSALRRFGAELGFEVPAQCVLGLTEDTERSLLVARGADGRLLRDFQPTRKQRLPASDLAGILPAEMVAALKPCSKVDVLARPPLQGRAELLPPEIAWSYRTRLEPPGPPGGKGLHLVVNDVQYEGTDMPPLRWTPHTAPGIEVRMLQGLDATPSRVLEAMANATEIDLATHGLISPGSDASYLLLARDVDGTDELHEDRIRQARLMGAPLVVLAACEAARGSTALHELASLPNAFLASGARAVIAATQKIPDEESSAFFGSVRERIRAGASPSVAVRDERQQWLREGKGTDWINGVLIFE